MAEEHDFKVAVLPCNGIGRVVSTVVRLAGYRIKEMRPEEVEQGVCVRVEEAIEGWESRLRAASTWRTSPRRIAYPLGGRSAAG